MSVLQQPLITLEQYARLPDRDGMIDDLIAGEVVYRPLHSALHGLVSGNVCMAFHEYRQRNGGSATLRCGMVVARTSDTVVSADAAFWRDRESMVVEQGWPTVPPQGAFEIVDTDEPYSEVMRRVRLLVGFGIGVLWLVDPTEEFVTEFRSESVRLFARSATLDGGAVLPGFSCKVADLFA